MFALGPRENPERIAATQAYSESDVLKKTHQCKHQKAQTGQIMA
jgi:hypothetical protein